MQGSDQTACPLRLPIIELSHVFPDLPVPKIQIRLSGPRWYSELLVAPFFNRASSRSLLTACLRTSFKLWVFFLKRRCTALSFSAWLSFLLSRPKSDTTPRVRPTSRLRNAFTPRKISKTVRLLYSGILKISSLCVQKQNVLETAYETLRRSTRATTI